MWLPPDRGLLSDDAPGLGGVVGPVTDGRGHGSSQAAPPRGLSPAGIGPACPVEPVLPPPRGDDRGALSAPALHLGKGLPDANPRDRGYHAAAQGAPHRP